MSEMMLVHVPKGNHVKVVRYVLLAITEEAKKDFQVLLFTIVMFSSVQHIYGYLLSEPAFIQFFTYCLMLRFFFQSNHVLLNCIFLHVKKKIYKGLFTPNCTCSHVVTLTIFFNF